MNIYNKHMRKDTTEILHKHKTRPHYNIKKQLLQLNQRSIYVDYTALLARRNKLKELVEKKNRKP